MRIVERPKFRFQTLFSNPILHYIVLVLVSISTRLELLSRSYPLSFDDGVYAMSIKHVSEGLQPFADVFSSQGPFFLTVVSLPSQIFGFHPWSMRIVPFLSGIAVVVFSYKISRRFMSRSWAFFAALLVALSGTLLRATVPITSDGVLAAVVLGCVLLNLRFIDSPKIVNAIWLGLAVGFGCGIKSIFMIPFLTFLLIVTWKISFKVRLIAGFISVVTFLVPFTIFGFKDTLDQSILYHLGKDESLDLKSNLSKIFTTFSAFDPILLLLSFLSVFVCISYLVQLVRSRSANRAELITRIFDMHKPYIFILTLGLGTYFLLIVQAPLFRNHLCAAVAPLAISATWIISRFISSLNVERNNAKAKSLGMAAVVIFLVVSIAATIKTYSDPLIAQSAELKGAIAALTVVKDGALIMTNDPGLAFATSTDVPTGLEDTSRFRFLNKNDEIKISVQSFNYILKNNKSICAFAVAPLPISDELKLRDLAPNTWNQVYDNGYTIWLNPSEDCVK